MIGELLTDTRLMARNCTVKLCIVMYESDIKLLENLCSWQSIIKDIKIVSHMC
jgi:hypothetical protein